MTLHRGSSWIGKTILLALTGLAGAGLVHVAVAQTKTPAPKAAPKKAPVRKVVPRVQTAPTRDRLIEIQQALTSEGFYSGKPSGKWDAATSQAMKNFQASKGLTQTGKLGALSLQNLGLGSEIAGKGAPITQASALPSALSESELDEQGPEPEEP